MPSVVTQLVRQRVTIPHLPLLERSLGFLRFFPQLYPSPPNIYKVLLSHRLPVLSHTLIDDSGEADRVITPTLQM